MMDKLRLPSYRMQITKTRNKAYIFDPLRKKEVRLTPEEWVRQHFIHYLINHLGYPPALIKIEATQALPSSSYKRRADILVFDQKKGLPLMLVECKAAQEKLEHLALTQVTQYNTIFHAPFLILTNGIQCLSYHIDHATKNYTILSKIPCFDTLTHLDHHALS